MSVFKELFVSILYHAMCTTTCLRSTCFQDMSCLRPERVSSYPERVRLTPCSLIDVGIWYNIVEVGLIGMAGWTG